MNLYERVLSVLSCRVRFFSLSFFDFQYADEVIIGAPWEVSKNLIESQGIHVVVEGTTTDPSYKEDISEDDGFSVSQM